MTNTMKRLAGILSLAVIILLSACTKVGSSLNGTKWTAAEAGAIYNLSFSANEFMLYEEVRDQAVYGDYVYDAPVVTLVTKKRIDSSGKELVGGGSISGRVNGQTLTLSNGYSSITFIKK